MQILREKVDGETYWGPDVIRDMSSHTKQERHVSTYVSFYVKKDIKTLLSIFAKVVIGWQLRRALSLMGSRS